MNRDAPSVRLLAIVLEDLPRAPTRTVELVGPIHWGWPDLPPRVHYSPPAYTVKQRACFDLPIEETPDGEPFAELPPVQLVTKLTGALLSHPEDFRIVGFEKRSGPQRIAQSALAAGLRSAEVGISFRVVLQRRGYDAELRARIDAVTSLLEAAINETNRQIEGAPDEAGPQRFTRGTFARLIRAALQARDLAHIDRAVASGQPPSVIRFLLDGAEELTR